MAVRSSHPEAVVAPEAELDGTVVLEVSAVAVEVFAVVEPVVWELAVEVFVTAGVSALVVVLACFHP